MGNKVSNFPLQTLRDGPDREKVAGYRRISIYAPLPRRTLCHNSLLRLHFLPPAFDCFLQAPPSPAKKEEERYQSEEEVCCVCMCVCVHLLPNLAHPQLEMGDLHGLTA